MDIGGRIRAARKAAGLSQEELARRADLSLNGVAVLERGGRTDPHYSTLTSIAGALGLSVAELLEEPAAPLAQAPPESSEEERRGEPGVLTGPLSLEWAYRADPDLFRRALRDKTSAELQDFGTQLSIEFARTRTRDELLENGPAPDVRRVRAFSLASVVNEELLRRGEEPLRTYVLAFRRFEDALSPDEVRETAHEKDQEHQAG